MAFTILFTSRVTITLQRSIMIAASVVDVWIAVAACVTTVTGFLMAVNPSLCFRILSFGRMNKRNSHAFRGYRVLGVLLALYGLWMVTWIGSPALGPFDLGPPPY